MEAKTEKLLAIYEEMIKDINDSKLLKKEKSMKAHFNNLKTDFNKKINKVLKACKQQSQWKNIEALLRSHPTFIDFTHRRQRERCVHYKENIERRNYRGLSYDCF